VFGALPKASLATSTNDREANNKGLVGVGLTWLKDSTTSYVFCEPDFFASTTDEENSKQLKSLVMSCRSTELSAPAGNAESRICVCGATRLFDAIAGQPRANSSADSRS
jgi:hypothetical protein